jgi:outer membrane biosynthesis protein TonB
MTYRPMSPRRRIRATPIALLAASGLVLAGCSATPSAGETAVEGFQARVLEVTESAVAEDYQAALDDLATLTTEVDYSFTRGEISEKKRDRIVDAIEAVTAQLSAALDPATTDQPGTTSTPAPSSDDAEETVDPEEGVEETPAPEETTEPSKTPAPAPTTSTPASPPPSTPAPTASTEPDPEPDPTPSTSTDPEDPENPGNAQGNGNGNGQGSGNGNGRGNGNG